MGRNEYGIRGCLYNDLEKFLCIQSKYGSPVGMSSDRNSFFSLNSPLPAGSIFSFSSLNHFGWVKSPVPITIIPLSCAHFQILSGDISLLVALEYLEWI